MDHSVSVIGAGLAGSAAAIAARQHGADVKLFEKSQFPRHKVCGEYLTPEIAPLLQSLGVWEKFLAANPAIIRRFILHFRFREKRCALPEPAFGLSRYCLDDLLHPVGQPLLTAAPASFKNPTVLAHGRKDASTRGGRLFGFKAHFEGPANDAIELFFFDGFYVGVNAVENGITNVCGLGPENILGGCNFDIDAVVKSCPALAERLRPLQRKFKWLGVGPLIFQNRFRSRFSEGQYPAGDALSFVDPFTGSGMLAALTTGRLAGIAAARETPVSKYIAQCRTCLERPFQFSSLFRDLVANGWGERLLPFVPGSLLIRLTRPRHVI